MIEKVVTKIIIKWLFNTTSYYVNTKLKGSVIFIFHYTSNPICWHKKYCLNFNAVDETTEVADSPKYAIQHSAMAPAPTKLAPIKHSRPRKLQEFNK